MKEKRNSLKKNKSNNFFIKILIIILLLLTTLLILFLLNKDIKEHQKNYQHPVKLALPRKGSLTKVFRMSGFIESEHMVHVLPQVSGPITKVFVESGQVVKKDQVLASINNESYALQLQQAQAAYTSYLSTWRRISRLWQNQNTTRQNYEEAKAGYEAALSQYELAKLQFNYTQIKAPLNATVLEKHVTTGSLVSPQAGTAIVTLADLDNLIVKAQVPEKYFGFFQENKMPIMISVPALSEKKIPASIKRISPYINAETRSFTVVCSIPQKSDSVKLGMYVHLEFVIDKRQDVYYLPLKVLINQKKFWILKKEDPPYSAKAINYSPDFFTEEEFQVPIKWKDEYFLIEGQHFIKEGMELKIINQEILAKRTDKEQQKNDKLKKEKK